MLGPGYFRPSIISGLRAALDLLAPRLVCGHTHQATSVIVQMTLPTAESISRCQDRRAYGVPTRETLHDPMAAFYFAAAALEELSTFDGDDRSLTFAVQAYVSGTSS